MELITLQNTNLVQKTDTANLYSKDTVFWMNRSLISSGNSSYCLDVDCENSISVKSLADRVITPAPLPSSDELLTKELKLRPTHVFLGYGGEGSVFEYRELSSNTLYAVKKIPPNKRKLFMRDKGSACGFFANHITGVVKTKAIILQNEQGMFSIVASIDDVRKTPIDQSYFITTVITEKIEGITLKQYFLSEGTVQNNNIIIQQVYEAISQLHQSHIMHRDIKPENIMVYTDPDTSDIEVTLLDFGLSARTLNQSRRNSCAGTCGYIESNRLQTGLVTYSYNVDLWALGVTAIEVVIRKRVFESDFSLLSRVDQAQFDLSRIKEQYHKVCIAANKLEMLNDEEKTEWLLANSTGYTAESELVKFILTHTAPSMRSAKLVSPPAI